MDDTYYKQIITTIIFIVLIVLSFFILKPILLSIIIGIILAFTFTPVYDWLYKITKSKNFSASLICFLLGLAIVLPLWFLTPLIIKQSIKVYLFSQQIDFVTPIKSFFPSLATEFSAEVGSVIHSFVTRATNSLMNSFSQLILNFPNLLLQFLVVFFTFFFILINKEESAHYIKSFLPFSKDVEKKLFESSKGITTSVIYGQVIVGIIQGLLVGVGLFIFKVPNALILTLFASLAGILPIIGTAIIWIPVAIYLFVAGNNFSALGVTFFGIISSTVDNLLKPIIVSKRTKVPSPLILIGMIGGFFMFGILGFILGPLILAYFFIILELYRNKKIPGLFVQEPLKE